MAARLAPLVASIKTGAGLDPPAWALEARVRERAAALDLGDEDYVARALGDADELARLVELLRVGETRFFRHRAQLEVLHERVLPALRGPVQAWSAGCASGEEAWTLAILLSERGLPFSLWATDLSPQALGRARDGRYPAARVGAEVPAALVQRYFRRIGDDCVLNDRLRAHVRFDVHNLLAAAPPRELDLVLCRNVLIYFDEARRAQVVGRLTRALKPGGWLLAGYSETLRDCAELTTEGHAVYRKHVDADAATGRARSPRAAAPTTLPPSLPPPTQASPGPPPPRPSTRGVALHGDYSDSRRLAAELRGLVGEARAVVELDGATFLGDAAARVLKRALEATPGLELRATRGAVRHWLGRHGIKPR